MDPVVGKVKHSQSAVGSQDLAQGHAAFKAKPVPREVHVRQSPVFLSATQSRMLRVRIKCGFLVLGTCVIYCTYC